MSFNNFFNRWIGKITDIDKVFLYQCVDLTKQYLLDVFGVPVQPMGNAIDWHTAPKKALTDKFDRITNKSPEVGDIVVLHGNPGNSYGHIGIAASRASGDSFRLMEQNGSTGNGAGKNGDVIRTRQIPTSRIAAVWRPKSSSNTSNPRYYNIKRGDTFWALERAWGMKTGRLQELNPKTNPRTLRIGSKIKIG